jgi:aromatic ring-opening dioxygenase catalytic subunit (LigB family)
MAKKLLAIFLGHGNPMNAVISNGYTEAWQRLGQEMPKRKAILSISAHWFVPGTGVTISTSRRTIHDFGGFPPELYQVKYDPRWPWHAAAHLGATVKVPKQYLRTQPSRYRNLFES